MPAASSIIVEVSGASQTAAGSWRSAFLVVLLLGIAIRAGILWQTNALGTPVQDEQQYVQLATSLAEGRGFAWASGEPTSLRPPLYPALIAAVWSITGTGALQAVRILQCLLSLATVGLVYVLGVRVFNARVAVVAASVVWLYPALILLDVTLLSETLFTLLLVAFVLLAVVLVRSPSAVAAVGCGLALGLGALTRSVLWPLPLVLCPLLALLLPPPSRQRLLLPLVVFAAYALVVGPWAYRNTQLQQITTIVDTMGGMNLRMGNYAYTPEDRAWDAVSMTGEKSWVYELSQEPPSRVPFTEGMKDKWAQRKAIAYMVANPGTTARRAVIKFADFWGLDRSFIAGVQQGLYRPPAWFVAVGTAASLVACVGVLLAGSAGIWLAHPDWRAHALLLLPIVAITGVHSLVFGHPRYHDPLVPFLALYASAAVLSVSIGGLPGTRRARAGAVVTALLLAGIWIREILVVEGHRVWDVLGHLL